MASDAAWIGGAVAANLEHSHAMSKFNAEMGGSMGMAAIDTEAGPQRTEVQRAYRSFPQSFRP